MLPSLIHPCIALQDVAVKRLDKIGQLGDEELFAEVENLSTLHHPNLVTFIGYCSERDQQRLLVYEYMPLGSLDRHLYGYIFILHPSSSHFPM